jgi:nucleoid-associated protein YgaU
MNQKKWFNLTTVLKSFYLVLFLLNSRCANFMSDTTTETNSTDEMETSSTLPEESSKTTTEGNDELEEDKSENPSDDLIANNDQTKNDTADMAGILDQETKPIESELPSKDAANTELTQPEKTPEFSADNSNTQPIKTDFSEAKEQINQKIEIIMRGEGGIRPPSGLPEEGSKIPYKVKKGDTLSKISKKIYGKTNNWKKIADWSGLSLEEAQSIHPGDIVYFQLSQETQNFASSNINKI